jgi:predicted enzyme related to lactoylglutathione lyase
MITHISSVSVYVADQAKAKDFYTTKLGFTVLMDEPMGASRWIQLAPKGAQTALVLSQPADDMPPEVNARARSLIGGFASFIFEVDDMQATYQELSGRGVEFVDKPAQQPWGWWATIKDLDGNIIGLHK